MPLFCLLVVAIFLSYGSPCVPLGHCHFDHAVPLDVAAAEVPISALVGTSSSGLKSEVKPCHDVPPHGVIPDSEVVDALAQAPPPVVGALLALAQADPRDGVVPAPGEALNGFGLARHLTGAAAVAALGILRT